MSRTTIAGRRRWEHVFINHSFEQRHTLGQVYLDNKTVLKSGFDAVLQMIADLDNSAIVALGLNSGLADYRLVLNCGFNVASKYSRPTPYLQILFSIHGPRNQAYIYSMFPKYPTDYSTSPGLNCDCPYRHYSPNNPLAVLNHLDLNNNPA